MPSCVAKLLHLYCLSPCDATQRPLLHTLANEDAQKTGLSAKDACASALASPAAFNQFVRARLAGAPTAAARGTRFKDDHNDTCMYIERSKNLNVVAYTVNYQGTPSFLTTRLTTTDSAGASADDHPQQEENAAAAESSLQPPRGPRTMVARDPLRAYWIKIEAEHVARRRGRGKIEDICELSIIEKKLAYGCKATAYGVDALHKLLSDVYGKKLASVDLSPDAQTNADAWLKAFQPCTAAFVALSSWPVVILSLPPLTDSVAADATTTVPSSATSFPHPDTTVPVMFAEINKEMSIMCKIYVKSNEPKHFYQLPSVEYIEAFGVSLETGEDTYEKREP